MSSSLPPYDPTKVERFVAALRDYEVYFFSVLMFGPSTLALSDAHLAYQRFCRDLSPWERVVVVYRLCEVMEGRMANIRRALVGEAREADDAAAAEDGGQ